MRRAATKRQTSSPGTYRVEVVTHELQEIRENGRRPARGRHRAGGRHAERGQRERNGDRRRPTRSTTSRSRARPSRAVSTSSSSTTFRATAAISSRSCSSTPTWSAAADDIQFLGGKTYGVSYIQDGQASTNAIFGTIGNSAPGLDAVSEMTVLSNSYSAEYGGLAGVVVTTKRGANSYRGTGFYDFNSDAPERPDLQPDTFGRRARRSALRHARAPVGCEASAAR